MVHSKSIAVLFWSKVDKRGPDDCWLWKPCNGKYKYGWFNNGLRQVGSHRFSLELKLGRMLVDGEFALHSCDNKPCVNPTHLFPGTCKDNAEDMLRKGRGVTGTRSHSARLNDGLVFRMRIRYAKGVSCTRMARRLGLTRGVIWRAVSGKTWKHVGGPINGMPKEVRNKLRSIGMAKHRRTVKR